MSAANIAIVRRWFEEVWNQRREATIDELLAADSICHSEEGPMVGPAEFKARQFWPFVKAFPNLRVEIEAAIGVEEQVVVRWVATGMHTASGLGFDATHQEAIVRGITWVHIRDGKMMEGWQSSNVTDVIRALSAKARKGNGA